MTNEKVVFIHDNNGDWVGLYVGGVLAMEGHSLEPDEVLEKLGKKTETRWIEMSDGRLPMLLTDVPE